MKIICNQVRMVMGVQSPLRASFHSRPEEPGITLEVDFTDPSIFVPGKEYELVINPVGEELRRRPQS